MSRLRVKDKQNKSTKHTNKSTSKKYPRYLYLIFSMSCVLIIMSAAIAEGGRYLPALIFSIIGVSGIYYVAWGTNHV